MDIAFIDIARSNKKYMIVIIDQFSKMISLTATNNHNKATVKSTLLNQWVYKFGKPQKIESDRGNGNYYKLFLLCLKSHGFLHLHVIINLTNLGMSIRIKKCFNAIVRLIISTSPNLNSVVAFSRESSYP